MKWSVLYPLSSTGFLLPNGAGEGKDILVDMNGPKRPVLENLEDHGSSSERISQILVTHFHGDHFFPEEALKLVRNGCRVYISRSTWETMFEAWEKAPSKQETLAACREIQSSGQLELLEPDGEMTIGERQVVWATFPHGDGVLGCDNLSYRIDDHLFTGDTSTRSLFNPYALGSERLLSLQNGSLVRVLCINIAQISRKEIHSRTDLAELRIRNYLTNHGILEDLLAVVENSAYEAFFGAVETIVPHHIRRPTLEESAVLIRERLLGAADRMGYDFDVVFQ